MVDKFWSLYGKQNLKDLEAQVNVLKEKYDTLQKKNYIKRNLRIAYYIILFFILLGFITFSLFLIVFSFPMVQFIIFPLVAGVIVYFIMKAYYNRYVVDIIKYKVAKHFGWFYEPNYSSKKWQQLKKEIPSIFNKGNTSQFVDDQYYGKIYSQNKAFNFHSGIFHYGVKSGKSTASYFRHFFAVKLNQKKNSSFFLYPENIGSKISNFFIRKEVNVESNEFNKKFAFSYTGEKNEKQFDILKIITPSMQLKLLDLYNYKGPFNVLFSEDYVIFDFKGKLINRLKTDFTKDVKINENDLESIKRQFKELVDIIQGIATKLN